MTECTLSLSFTSSFGLCRIHALQGSMEFLEAAFLGKIILSIQPLGDYKLLPDDRSQICDMVLHHLAVLDPLLNKSFEPLRGWPLEERWWMNVCESDIAEIRFRTFGTDRHVPLLSAFTSLVTFARLA
jgi:hypothetical protein